MYQALGYLTRGTGQWQIPNASSDIVSVMGHLYRQCMGGGPVVDSSQYPTNPFPNSLSASADYPPYLGLLVPTSGQSIPYRGTSLAFHDQGFSNNVALPTPSENVTISGSPYCRYVHFVSGGDIGREFIGFVKGPE